MIKKDQYEAIADCIRSDQVSAPEGKNSKKEDKETKPN